MNKQDLEEKLQQLHSQLEEIEVDENKRSSIEQLMADIQHLLELEQAPETHKYKRLGEKLRENVAQFEATHPTATMLMGQAIDIMVQMGI
jgi:tRNA C32,U32 (ribose-2'-O)-methylase TrmJ